MLLLPLLFATFVPSALATSSHQPNSNSLAESAAADNELVGEPVVECEETMVSLTFKTKKPFNGRVYVQGMADDERCSRNFASNADQSKFSMMIQNGDCTSDWEHSIYL